MDGKVFRGWAVFSAWERKANQWHLEKVIPEIKRVNRLSKNFKAASTKQQRKFAKSKETSTQEKSESATC